jgi:Cof subfamily protein (haloacid dehalogenase superfamily)
VIAAGRAGSAAAGKSPEERRAVIEVPPGPAPARLPRPRLLACDIDGTILDDRGVLRPQVRDAIAAIAASGVEVVLATGRSPWSEIPEISASLGLSGPQIMMQGALFSNPATGEVHRLRALPPGLYRDSIGFARELGLDPVVALLDGHRAERLPQHVELFVPPIGEGRAFHFVNDLADLADHGPIRVFLPTDLERHHVVRTAAMERFADEASIVWSDTSGIEFLAAGTHKGEAIAWLAAARGIGLDEVAAVGDATNDTEMLRIAGRSAAMGSAPRDVQAAADIVVPTSNEDGVLHAFAWFFPDLVADLAQLAARG